VNRVYRIAVTSYPTPDGLPFDRQPTRDYWAAVENFSNPSAEPEPVPEWLKDLDLTERVYGEDDDYRAYPQPGVTIMDGSEPLLTVPTLRRVHFFSKQAAERRLKYLTDWGALGHVEMSEPITWSE